MSKMATWSSSTVQLSTSLSMMRCTTCHPPSASTEKQMSEVNMRGCLVAGGPRVGTGVKCGFSTPMCMYVSATRICSHANQQVCGNFPWRYISHCSWALVLDFVFECLDCLQRRGSARAD